MVEFQSGKRYGDTKQLKELSTGLKQGAGDEVPMPRRPVGRPQGATGPQQPSLTPGDPAPPVDIPEEHISLMDRAGRAVRVADIAALLTADPLGSDPWIQRYAEVARAEAEKRLREVRDLTPNFVE